MDSEIYRLNKGILVSIPPLIPFRMQVWRYILLPANLRKSALDVVHDPSGVGPLSLVDGASKKVVTIHSLLSVGHEKLGLGWTYNPLGSLAYKLFGHRTIRKVDSVIAVSRFLKEELQRYLKVPEEKIRVIYHGVTADFRQMTQEQVSRVRRKYGISASNILYVGALDKGKNVSTLIEAFYRLKTDNRIGHRLIIVGPKGRGFPSLFQTVRRLNIQDQVDFLGRVPHNELPALYNMADLFVFPSIYETFGLPLVEAMACGVPVVAASAGSIPEVVDNAGKLFNPYSVDDMSGAMREVLTVDDLRESMIRKGLERSKIFNWKRTAQETLQLYRAVTEV
jgi:glycosyltransferase involved in cell wall biosynthesis